MNHPFVTKQLFLVNGLIKKVLLLFLLGFATNNLSAQVVDISIDSLRKSIQGINLKQVWEEEQSEMFELLDQKDQEIEKWKSLTFYNGSRLVPCISKLRVYEILEEIELYGTEPAKRKHVINSDDISIDTFSNGALKTIRFFVLDSVHNLNITSFKSFVGNEIDEMMQKNKLFFKRQYPIFIKLKKNGQIIFQTTDGEFKQVNAMEVRRVSFPPLIISGKTLIEKERLALRYINSIREIVALEEFQQYSLDAYLNLEKEEAPDNNIDKILRLRVAFIKILKKEYEKKTN
jgi:hypothetical protein